MQNKILSLILLIIKQLSCLKVHSYIILILNIDNNYYIIIKSNEVEGDFNGNKRR